MNSSFAPRSAKRKLASVRAFYRALELDGILEDNPFNRLNIRIHMPHQLPRTIPGQTVHDILQAAYDAYKPGCRNVLKDIFVLELLFSTGLRVSELCSLTRESFLLSSTELRLLINGKGSKERLVPFGRCARDAVDCYLSARAAAHVQPSDYVFFRAIRRR